MRRILQVSSQVSVAHLARSTVTLRNERFLTTCSRQHLIQARASCRDLTCTLAPSRFLSNTSRQGDGNDPKNQKKGGFWSSLTGSKDNRSLESANKSGKKSEGARITGHHEQRDSGRVKPKQRESSKEKARDGRWNSSNQSGNQPASTKQGSRKKNLQSETNSTQAMETRSSKPGKSIVSKSRRGKDDSEVGRGVSSSGINKSIKDRQSMSSSGDMTRKHEENSSTRYEQSAVRHDKKKHKFSLDLGDGQVACIEYRPMADNVIEMFHTEVPEQLRGRGIARVLVRGALEQAEKANMRCKLTCSYLLDYLERFANDRERRVIIDS